MMLGSFLAQRLQSIKPSVTLVVNSKAIALKKEGKDVINLSAGEPDFDTPTPIKEAACLAIKNGQTKYTNVDGTAELKQAIVQKFKRENGLDFTVDQITVANGGKQVLYNAFMATLNPKDEVVIPAPYWTSYPEMVALAEGTPVIIQAGQELGFKILPEQLERAITPRTKWFILNSPSNPTGAAYTQNELEKLAAVLQKHPHVHIMVDDIYEHLTYDDFQFRTLAQVAPDLKDRVLTINGVSKAFSMTGWRIGYAAGSKELIKAICVIQSQSTSNPCSISQAAAVAALNGDLSFQTEWRKSFKERRDMVCHALNSMDGVSCNIPQGAFYVFPGIHDLLGRRAISGQVIENDVQFATYLLEEALVAVVPGAGFGLNGHFRISYAADKALLVEGMKRIARAIDQLK